MSHRYHPWKRHIDAAVLILGALAGPALAGGEEQPLATANLAGFGAVAVRVVVDATAARLVIERADGGARLDLPPLDGADEFAFYQMTDVAFTDLNGDGVVDLLAVAQFLTGIGPTGADPFPLATVYLRRGDAFERAPDLEGALNDPPDYGKWTNAEDAVAILK